VIQHPAPGECDEYYNRYIEQVPDGDLLDILERGVAETRSVLAGLTVERETYRYEPGKWSVREVVGHVLDSERAFAYRALAFARLDPAPYPSFDQDEYAAGSNAHERALADLMAEWSAVREANVLMFRSFGDETWDLRGVASGYEFTVRALAFIIAGHEIWHRGTLRERYLGG
jgi:uncharacterized damage-inducible protein DinB